MKQCGGHTILTVFNLVLLLFYHETSEWPTRLNEVNMYTYNIIYIYIAFYVHIYMTPYKAQH